MEEFNVGDTVKSLYHENYDEIGRIVGKGQGGVNYLIEGFTAGTKEDGYHVFCPELLVLVERNKNAWHLNENFVEFHSKMVRGEFNLDYYTKPEKLNIKKRVMNYLNEVSRAIRKTLSPRVRDLLKFGLLNEDLELTDKGQQIVDEALLEQKFIMDALDKEARDLKAEEKKK